MPGIPADLIRTIEELNRRHREVFSLMVQTWKDGVLLSWHWWMDLALSVLPWALWLIVHNRPLKKTPFPEGHTHRLLAAGFVTLVTSSVLDMVGIYLGMWEYHTFLLPVVPAYLPWDWSVFPVTAMLFYQFFPRINPWIKAAVFSAIGAFVAEPLFALIGTYHLLAWRFWYSPPLYFAVFMLGWAVYAKRPRVPEKA